MRLQAWPTGFLVVVRYCERPVFSSLRSGRRSFCRGRSGVLDVFSPGLFMKQSGTIRRVRGWDRRTRETTTVVTEPRAVATGSHTQLSQVRKTK